MLKGMNKNGDKMNHHIININKSSVAFLTLGCKVNSYETDGMQKLFEDAGFEIVDFSQKADIYVINTCTVTNIADRKSRQMLHKARKMNKDAIVVATGCYVQASKDTLEQDNGVDIIIGNNHKKDIIPIIQSFLEENNKAQKFILDIDKVNEFEELGIETVSEKTRAYIKIQDGCNQFCSYCIIPYARGRVRSRSMDSVIREVNQLVKNGYKEVVLTGIHLSSYGIDIDDEKKSRLLELILELSKNEQLNRIRLGSLEPGIITEEFVQTLSKCPKLCPHFHLSLQSGCDATLKQMNRKYRTKEYKEKCELLRQYFDNPAITTDVIVGFPGETNEDFNQSKEFVTDIAFSQMHIFKYSMRKGTVAAKLPNQVNNKIKQSRSNLLMDIALKMKKEYMSSFLGKTENILIEERIQVEDQTYQIGHNERYIKVAIKEEKDYINEIIPVKINKFLNKEILFGEI